MTFTPLTGPSEGTPGDSQLGALSTGLRVEISKYTVQLLLNDEIGACFRAIWQEAKDRGITSFTVDMGHAPRITVSLGNALRNGADNQKLGAQFSELVSTLAPVELSYHQIATFGAGAVINFIPTVTQQLLDLHRSVDHIFSQNVEYGPIGNNYRPGIWVPHSAICMEVPPEKRKEAMLFALEMWEKYRFPRTTKVETIALVNELGTGWKKPGDIHPEVQTTPFKLG